MVHPPDRVRERKRGRPQRLSRGQIVDVAVRLARCDPSKPLTIKRVAEAAGSAPTTLYRYFPDRDDLLRAVAGRIMDELGFEVRDEVAWQDQLRAWMEQSRAALVRYPQLALYIVSTQQPLWVPPFAILGQVLSPLRLSHEDLALAVTFVGATVVGYAFVEGRRPAVPEQQDRRVAGADRKPSDEVWITSALNRLPPASNRLHDIVIEQIIAAIEALADGYSRDSGTGPRL